MEPRGPSSRGFLSSLQGLGSGLIATLHDRVALFSLELHEEKFRLIQIFIWISAAIFFGMLTVALGSVALVYQFSPESRGKALLGLTLFYALVVLGIVLGFRRYLRRQPKPFSGTLSELKEDARVSSGGVD